MAEGWRERIVRALGGVTPAQLEARVREAIAAYPALGGQEPDDWKFRRLTANPTRDIAPVAQDRMINIAAFLFDTNPLAGSIVELTRDYVVGKGITAASLDPDVDRVIRRFWNDGCNRMDLKLPEKVLQLSLFGEQCWPAYVSENYGLVRLGYVDPYMIDEVIPDPDNVELLIGLVTRTLAGGAGKRYRIILNEDEGQIVSDAGRRELDRFTDGECFYFAINRLSNSTRGRSDLLRLMDWLDGYEQFLFENLDRVANHLMTFIWDITFKGLSESQIEEKMLKMRPPRRGSLRGHNENVEWDAVAPDLKGQDVSELIKVFKRHIIGVGTRYPLIWFGDPEDVNRAAATEMSDPPVVKLGARQLYTVYMLHEMLRYQVAKARAAGTLSADLVQLRDKDGTPKGDPVPLHEAIAITAPEITVRDTAKTATALPQLATALTLAQQEGWLTKETAATLFALVASQLGVDIDASKEVQDERVTADYADPRKIRSLAEALRGRHG